ncbi:MAG: hypothetical protein IJY37_01095 [Clostridia bacterium]|nr:hypothetical protein [Clostridia bacterium]
MKAVIYPLEKVVLGDISITFGMKKSEAERLLGKATAVGERRYYLGAELAVSYDAQESVEFIEFLGGKEGSLRPMLYGVSVFEENAEDLLALLTEKNDGDVIDRENGYSYQFSHIGIGLYREMTPQDVEEMIAEMKAHGILTEQNPDLEADKEKALHFATVGAGVCGYYTR